MQSLKPPSARHWLLIWIGSVVVAIAAIGATARLMAQQHLIHDAEDRALQYAHLVQAAIPGMENLFRTGLPTEQTLEQLRRMRKVDEIFHIKLFAADGRQLLTSDDLDEPGFGLGGGRLGDHHAEQNDEVIDVVLGGRSFIELEDDDGRANHPAFYSEAYVPFFSGGEVTGVIEVYVDQTATRDSIHTGLAAFAAVVSIAIAGLGGIGLIQLRQRLAAQHRAEERVRYLAQHDPLSGALNRSKFNEILQHSAWCHESGGPGFAVLYVDLDRFKDVNDSLGHAGGDDVLRQVAHRLRAVIREGDELARLGGDEFAILQGGVSSADDVSRLARRVVDVLGNPFVVAGQTVAGGASVGAAIHGADAQTIDELMQRADLALYRAKANGRGRFSFYDAALDEQLQARREQLRELRDAVANEALTLHYQPLYAKNGETLVGYEALLRWTHPVRGNVPPSEFIPLAEESGLIEPLGAWVLERACREAAAWPGRLSVSVNLSAVQFRSNGLVGVVTRALAESGLSPQRLELEITESLLMSDTEHVIRTLEALSGIGVRIAMDDFGTGYSSLAYLWRFPFDKLKIDRAFTRGLEEDPKVNLIVRSIVSLAHAMRIRVNAEGVETLAQMRMLQRHGCDELQGFLLGRPMPPESLLHANANEQPIEPPQPSASGLMALSQMTISA